MACQIQRLPFREAAVFAFPAPRGIRSLCPGGVNPSWRANNGGIPLGMPPLLHPCSQRESKLMPRRGRSLMAWQNPADLISISAGFLSYFRHFNRSLRSCGDTPQVQP